MALFMVVELPQGVLSILSSLTGTNIPKSESIGDLFDIFSLLNSCVTFGLFCSMNSRIRHAVTQGFCSHNYKRLQQLAQRLPFFSPSSAANKLFSATHLTVLVIVRFCMFRH